MWVEADCNLSGGEALARQFLLGDKYFAEQFGVGAYTPVLWLPDVFGFPWSLPQLAKEAGHQVRLHRCPRRNPKGVRLHHWVRRCPRRCRRRHRVYSGLSVAMLVQSWFTLRRRPVISGKSSALALYVARGIVVFCFTTVVLLFHSTSPENSDSQSC